MNIYGIKYRCEPIIHPLQSSSFAEFHRANFPGTRHPRTSEHIYAIRNAERGSAHHHGEKPTRRVRAETQNTQWRKPRMPHAERRSNFAQTKVSSRTLVSPPDCIPTQRPRQQRPHQATQQRASWGGYRLTEASRPNQRVS